tara:strand:- start:54 stop:1661 length:1608 start_codon:yes stop_codon:yes gene_type:complete
MLGLPNVTGHPSDVNSTHVFRLLFISVVGALLKLWLVVDVDFGKDEVAYWYWAQQFDASYSALPLIAIRLASTLSHSEIVIRVPFVLMGIVSTLLMYAWCVRCGLNYRIAYWATIAFATSHWIWHTTSFLHPDGFLVPCWLATVYIADVACDRSSIRGKTRIVALFSVLGACAGFSVLSKYSGAGLAAGIMTGIMIHQRYHGIALVAAFSGLALVTSTLVATLAESGFHMPVTLGSLSKIVANQPMALRFAAFVSAPMFYISLPLWIALTTSLAHLIHLAWRTRATLNHRLMLLLLPVVCTITAFAFFALVKGQVKGNWILPAMLGIWPFAFGAKIPGQQITSALKLINRRWFMITMIALGLAHSGAVAWILKVPAVANIEQLFGQTVAFNYRYLVSKEDQVREPSRSWEDRLCEYHGWRQFAHQVENRAAFFDGDKQIPIVSNQYQIVFAQAFYGNFARPVYTIDDPRFHNLSALSNAVQSSDTLLFVTQGYKPVPHSLRNYKPSLFFDFYRQTPGCRPIPNRATLLIHHKPNR